MSKRPPQRATKAKLTLATLGQAIAAAPPFRERMEIAKRELVEGVPEDEIRRRIVEWGDAEGLVGPRAVLPSLTRKVLRMSAARLIREIADELTRRAGSRKVGDFVSGWMEKLGMDEWLATYIVEWARTGEPGDFYIGATGRVFRQKLGVGPDAAEGVGVLATPLSDPRELAVEFLAECERVMPASTWSRYGVDPQAARYFRLIVEGRTYRDLAEEELGQEELARLRRLGPRVVRERIDQEAGRIRKLVARFSGYLWTLSPDELSG